MKKYKLIINDSKEIYFEASDKYYQEDINKFEDRIIDSCHEVSLYMIKKYKEYTAVTSICTKELNKKFYHSFILNNNTIIDLTANLIMDKDTYYELNKVQELNKLNYQEYLNEKDKSIEFDKNNELFELLRMALFKQNKK